MTNYEDMNYNDLRSEASEKGVSVSSNPSKDELIEALEESEDADLDEPEGEPETESSSDSSSAIDEALNLKPSKDADETLLDHGQDSEEEIVETGEDADAHADTEEAEIEGEDQSVETGKEDVQVVEQPEFDDQAAAQLQLGLNRIQRILGDALLSIKPAKLTLDDVRESAPATRDAVNMLMPRGLQGEAGKTAALFNVAAPHIEAWQIGMKQVQKEQTSEQQETKEEEEETAEEENRQNIDDDGYSPGETL